MSLPITMWGIIVAVLGVVAVGSGIWLLLRARDVARLSDTPGNDVVPGPRRRPAASRRTVRIVLVINILATVGALGLFALIANRTIGSSETQTDPYTARP